MIIILKKVCNNNNNDNNNENVKMTWNNEENEMTINEIQWRMKKYKVMTAVALAYENEMKKKMTTIIHDIVKWRK